MTNSQPPEPRSSRRTPLGFDDFIGILVAFGTIGAILFWSFLQKSPDGNIFSWLSPAPSSTVQPNVALKAGTTATNAPPATQITPNTGTTTNVAPVAPVDPNAAVSQAPQGQVVPPGAVAVAPNNQRQPVVGVVPAPAPVQPKTEAPLSTAPEPTQAPVAPAPPAAKVTPVPVPAAAPKLEKQRQAVAFTDVKGDYWAKPFIDALSARGVIDGFASKQGKAFQPNTPITRAEFAALIQKTFGNQPGGNKTAFKDVPGNFWATSAIDGATKTRFMKGYPNSVFRPQQKIPREQVVVALASGLGLKPSLPPAQVVGTFNDAPQISNYAVDRIAAATEAGIVVNYPKANEFKPKLTATRAEVAAMVYQALVKAGKVEPIASKHIVKPQ